MPLKFNVTTGVQDGSPATVLYQNTFEADRTVDFESGVLTHSATAYDSTGLWTGDTEAGCMYFGTVDGGIEEAAIKVPVSGLQIELYWVMASWDFVSTGFDIYGQNRVYLEWLDSGGAIIGVRSDNITELTYGHLSYSARRPVGAVELRIIFSRRTMPNPLAIFYLQVHDVLSSGETPLITDLLPNQYAVAPTEGVPMELDYVDSFDPPIDGLVIESAPAELGVTTDGTKLVLTPTEGGTLPFTGGLDLEDTVIFRGKSGIREAFNAQYLYAFRIPATTLTVADDIPTIWQEDGKFIVLDPIYFVSDGSWPYTAVINAKPTWLEEGPNGLLAGVTSGSGTQTTISATVTDAVGQTVIVNIPFEIFSVDRTSPTLLTAAAAAGSSDGSILKAITQDMTSPQVIQLEDADYVFGNTYMLQRPGDKPLVVMGPATLTGFNSLNQAEGIWFEDVTFETKVLPDLSGTESQRRANRSLANLGQTPRAVGTTQAFSRADGCTFQGLKTDLSHETLWTVREFEGGLIYDENGLIGTEPTTGQYSETCYNGGLAAQNWFIAQDCSSLHSVFPLQIGRMTGIYNWTSDQTRVDEIRVGPTYGSVIWNLRAAATPGSLVRLNGLGDEHADCFQTIADSNGPVGERLWLKGMIVRGREHPGIQGWQYNAGTSGSYDENDTPTILPDGHRFEDCILTGSLVNGVNFGVGKAEWIRCIAMPDPIQFNPVTGTGKMIFNMSVAAYAELTDCIFTTLQDEQTGPRVPWAITNTLVLDDNPSILATLMPNLYAAEDSIEDDPRLAADPTTARFWIDETVMAVGPTWARAVV